jgi:hypothetical protein
MIPSRPVTLAAPLLACVGAASAQVPTITNIDVLPAGPCQPPARER